MASQPSTSASEHQRLHERVAELEARLAQADAERREAIAHATRRDEQWNDYLQLFHAIPVGIAYVDRERVFRLCNKSAAGFLGRGVEQIVETHLRDAVPDNPQTWEIIENALASVDAPPVQQISITFSDRPEDGPHDFLVAFLHDTSPDGVVRGIYITSQEVTELVQTQEALAFLTDASTQLAGSIDYDATLQTAVELAVPRLADFCMIDVVTGGAGQVVARAVDPDRERLLYEVRQHYPFDPREDAPWTTLVRDQGLILAPDADAGQIAALARDAGHADYLRRIGARSTLFIPLLAGDEMAGILSLGMAESNRRFGLADQRLAEELARRVATSILNATIHRDAQSAEARYRGLFEGAADAIVVVDGDGYYIDVNPAMSELTGYSRDELLRFRAGDGQLTSAGPGLARPRFEQIREEGSFRGEMELRRKNGTIVPVESVIRAIHLPEGTAFINMMRDISRRRELERMQREFMAIVTHELKGPLTSIKGFSQIMRRQERYNERAVDSILLQTGQIERLVNDMLDAASSDADRLELQRDEVDLVRLTQLAIDQARAASPSHDIRIDTNQPELIGHWDAERLVQIFSNLLSNAVKYSPDGGNIVVTVERVDDIAHVSIADQGIGIPSEALPRLFERFYRVEDTGHLGIEGLGLGLYITRSLIEAHGGQISVTSDAGHGSTFSFTLPCSTT
ncbi:MAG TPA: ATP-binding protein [Thermomicrobiales bacterium]|nr:ATP-binding protein [Thermomicrobiales bacterium]